MLPALVALSCTFINMGPAGGSLRPLYSGYFPELAGKTDLWKVKKNRVRMESPEK